MSRERENQETVKFEVYGRTVEEKHKLSSLSIKAFFTKMLLFLHFRNTEIRVILGENVLPLSLCSFPSLWSQSVARRAPRIRWDQMLVVALLVT